MTINLNFLFNEGIALAGATAPLDSPGVYPHERGCGNDKSLRSAVSIGYRLSRSVLETLVDGPNQLYYFHYQRVNLLLDSVALQVAGVLQLAGFDALPVPASQVMDWKNMTGLISHRYVAVKAGLAWRGRNNLAVSPLYGSQVRYATILTDAPLAEIDISGPSVNAPARSNGTLPRCRGTAKSLSFADASPAIAGLLLWKTASLSGCGDCRACINACPAGAIGETPADFRIDLCIAKLKSFRKERKISQMICGMCVKTCPGKMAFEMIHSG
jgi:epoxyqueuosine reductase QueG